MRETSASKTNGLKQMSISSCLSHSGYTRLSFNQPYTFRLGSTSGLLLVFKDQTVSDHMTCLVTVEALRLCTLQSGWTRR